MILRIPLSLSLILCAAPSLAAGQGVGLPSGRETWFRDESVQRGVLFEHQDFDGNYTIGSGSAWFDLEGDGDEDLLVLSSAGEPALYRNGDGKFVDIAPGSGFTIPPGAAPMGVAVADHDADGLQDVYVCCVGTNAFFVNAGSGSFVEQASPLGLKGGDAYSIGASWADFDLDGDLDLYVGNYVETFNFPHHYGMPNFLFRNDGPGANPQFSDVAPLVGADNVGVFGPTIPGFGYVSPEGEPTAGCTLSTGSLDWDEDGDPDLQVGNDFGLWVLPNALLRNDQVGGSMAFTDISSATGFDTRPHYNMGIYPADFDHDGDWDFYNSNLGDNLLLRNDGGLFVDVTYDAGPLSGSVYRGFEILKLSSWGFIFEDLNNDSWEDIFVVNGHIVAAWFLDNSKRSGNDLWRNEGDGTFSLVRGLTSGAADRGPGRSVSKVDLNSDGLLDHYLVNNGSIYVSGANDRSRLFMNTGFHAAGNWMEFDLVGRIGHPDALGARLDLSLGAEVLKRQRLGDGCFLSSNSRMVHFGLGGADVVDMLEVFWPSGVVQTLRDMTVNQRLSLLEPAVTGEGIQALSYSAGTLTVSTIVQNHDKLDQLTSVVFELRDAADGSMIAEGVGSESVLSGASKVVGVSLPLPPPAYAAYQGQVVEVSARVSATGSEDHDRADLLMP